MSHYRKIDTRINNDAKFRSLKPMEQWLWYRLMTHDHMTAIGGIRITIGGLAEELGIRRQDCERYFLELARKNLISHDEKNNIVVFKNFIRYNRPESPNVVKSWDGAIDLLPECELRDQLIQQIASFIYKNFNEAFQEALPEAFRKAFRKTMPNQEQEQKQEQNNKISTSAHAEKIEIIANEENKKIFELPTKKGDNFPIFESDVTIFKNNYPAIDVKNELEKMKLWLTDKQFPKNYFSMREFVNSWLSKAQHESVNIRTFEKQGVKHYAKTGAINTKQPSAFEQAMSPGVQWAIAE
jgi:hypothetical protein